MKFSVPIGSYQVVRQGESLVLMTDDAGFLSEQITDLEIVKLVGRQALDKWWKNVSVDVSDVGKLPMESTFNSHAFNSALHLDTDAVVIDIDDTHVVIPKDSVREKLREFNRDLKSLLDTYDRVDDVINTSTEIHPILAASGVVIDLPISVSEPVVESSEPAAEQPSDPQ